MWRSFPLIFIFFVLMTLTFYIAASTSRNNEQSAQSRLENYANQIDNTLQYRVALYAEILRGGSGLYNSMNGSLTRQVWQQYVSAYDFQKNLPNVVRVSYAPFVKSDDKAFFTESVATNYGYTDYKIWPEKDKKQYAPILFAEPFVTDTKLVGYDLFEDSSRAETINEACKSKNITLTNPLHLLVDSSEKTDGLSVVQPLYDSTGQTCTGVIFLNFRISTLFNSVVQSSVDDMASVQITDSNDKKAKVIYASSASDLSTDSYTSATVPLTLYNQRWWLNLVADSSIVPGAERNRPLATIVLGTLFSILLFMLLYVALRSRSREIEFENRVAVESTKEELLSLASHQLRTPATGVKQYTGMLLQGFAGDLPDEQHALLQKAYDANERQLEIINQILHITRIETGSLELGRDRFDLGSLIDDVVDEQQENIENKRHSVAVNLPKHSVMYIGDKFYLRMVFENLLTNAVKYTRYDGEIGVRLARRASNILIEFSDNGVGMSEEEQKQIFDKFTRINNELSVEAGGSGIGLYLAKKIVELHGGTIEVESSPNDGTTFRVLLPRKDT